MDYRIEIDYSSLELYMSCPRRFFFRYILHLETTGANIDLIFGSCWHLGLECAYKVLGTGQHLTIEDETEIAFKGFGALWTVDGKPHFGWDETFPKSPSRARQMYYEYFKRWLSEDAAMTVVAVEKPFTISASANLPTLRGRMDRVLSSDTGTIYAFESKTSKYATPTVFLGYECSMQTEIYLTAVSVYFDMIPVIVYDQALCQKSKMDFTRYEISRSASALDRFLDDYKHYCSQLLRDLDELSSFQESSLATDRRAVMPCFHRKPGYACTMYFRACPYWDLCKPRNNPLTYATRVPEGYHYREWHPADHAAHQREVLAAADLDKLVPMEDE